jgi:type IV secretion system protein VirB5
MKKVITALLFIAAIQSQQAFAMAVTDLGHTMQTMMGWVQQAKDMTAQVNELKKQYDTMKQEYDSISGIRNMGDLVNNPALRKYLPDDYQQILQGGYSSAQSLRDSARVSGFNDANPNSEASKALEKSGMQAAINEATAEDGYKQASKRFDDIQALLEQINQAPDQKTILDLQARIQVEQVMQQNEATKLAMLGQLAAAQKDLALQAQVERRIKNVRAAGVYPTTF